MADSNINTEIFDVNTLAFCNPPTNENLLSEYFGFFSIVDDIFARLLRLTSYLAYRFLHFIEDLVDGDVNKSIEGVSVNTSELHPSSSTCSSSRFVSNGCSSSSIHSSANSRFGIPESASGPKRNTSLNSGYGIEESNYDHRGSTFISQGLMLPICGLRLACRLALGACRFSLCYLRCTQLKVQRIMSRMQKTLNGSSDDIGWLQRTPGMAPVEDGSARFQELLDDIRDGRHTLPSSYVYLLIPGLFSNHGPLYFVSTKKFFSKMGLTCHIAKIHSEASVEHNSWELKQYIEELYWGSGKPVMLLGHSKGGVDAAAALSLYWGDLKGKVAGLALVQSPYGGTPLASDILREGQIADKETRRIMELLICKLIKGDIQALEDLTYEKRKEFLHQHKLPEDIPLISFRSEASIGPGVLATLSQIAIAELPWLPFPRVFTGEEDGEARKVPVVIPVSTAMAVCALHLQLRYGEKSDGLVTCRDAEVPGSVVVRPVRKLDHAWMVYSSMKEDPIEPNASEMCEALLTMLVELGKGKGKQLCLE